MILHPLHLASIHIEKTAGTSLQSVLAEWYGTGLALHYACTGHIDPVDAHTRCLHGHVAQHLMPESEHTFTMLRDPVRRVISHYHYWQRVPPNALPHPVHQAVYRGDLELAEFAREIPNLQSTYLVDPEAITVIGLVEQAASSLLLLADAIGLPTPVKLPRANAAPTRHTCKPSERAAILAANRDDSKLYEYAERQFLRAIQ